MWRHHAVLSHVYTTWILRTMQFSRSIRWLQTLSFIYLFFYQLYRFLCFFFCKILIFTVMCFISFIFFYHVFFWRMRASIEENILLIRNWMSKKVIINLRYDYNFTFKYWSYYLCYNWLTYFFCRYTLLFFKASKVILNKNIACWELSRTNFLIKDGNQEFDLFYWPLFLNCFILFRLLKKLSLIFFFFVGMRI